jgi:transcription elongation factor Elf1
MSTFIDTKYLRLLSSRLRNFKQKGDNLFNFSCPYCGDSQKNKLKARGYVFQKSGGLFFKCHNCGVGTNVGNLIKHTDSTLFNEYTMERYKAGESGNANYSKPTFDIPAPRFDKIEKRKEFEHAEWLSNLPSGHFCLEYATKRQIPQKFYDKLLFTAEYERFITTLVPNHGKQLVNDARLVIPFYNEYNELIAVSGRALETNEKTLRYVTIRTNDSEDKLIYGMERINLNESVKIVEGPIDSLFLNNCLASGDANLAITAKLIKSEKKVLIFDNEKRNKQIVKMMQDAINLDYDVVIWPDNIQGKDINEMLMNEISTTEIERIISSNTFKGLEAKTRFTFWKKV